MGTTIWVVMASGVSFVLGRYSVGICKRVTDFLETARKELQGPVFQVRRTIRRDPDKFPTGKAYLKERMHRGVPTTDAEQKRLESLRPFPVDEVEAQLVSTTLARLGFKKEAEYGQICARAKELGATFCPVWVKEEMLHTKNVIWGRAIYATKNEGDSWYAGDIFTQLRFALGYDKFELDDVFVFCLPRKEEPTTS